MGGVNMNIEVNDSLLTFKNITLRGQFMFGREQSNRFITMIGNGKVLFGEQVESSSAASFPPEGCMRL